MKNLYAYNKRFKSAHDIVNPILSKILPYLYIHIYTYKLIFNNDNFKQIQRQKI